MLYIFMSIKPPAIKGVLVATRNQTTRVKYKLNYFDSLFRLGVVNLINKLN